MFENIFAFIRKPFDFVVANWMALAIGAAVGFAAAIFL